LPVLVASHHDSSYPKRLLESTILEERIIPKESLRDALQALASAPYINSFGEKLIERIATEVGPEQLKTIASTPSALMLLLSRNPQLARFQELWSVTSGRHQQVLDLISSSHLSQPDWEEIMHAAVEARVPQIARSFVRILGVSAVQAALNICHQFSVTLPSDWSSVFWEQTPTVAEWLRSQSGAKISLLCELASNLNPFDSTLLSLDSEIWQAVLDADAKPSQRGRAFILLLGFQNPSGKPYELVAQTFETIHRDAFKTGRRSNEFCFISHPKSICGPSEDTCSQRPVQGREARQLPRVTSFQSMRKNFGSKLTLHANVRARDAGGLKPGDAK
jgi:hypothetical protein